MVIQRSWKIQNEAGSSTNILQISAASSSEDSNGSNQTINSVVTSNTNNSATKMDSIKYVTTPQMAENVLGRLKQRFGHHVSGRKSSSDAAMRSLELLRITIQTAFDKDVDTIVKKFIEVYFKPAIKNIKENLGDHIVTEEMLQKMMCALLENSKSQYNLHRTKPTPGTVPAPSITPTAVSEQITIKPEISTQTNFAIKRPAPKTFTTDISAQASKKFTLTVSQQQETPPPPASTPTPTPTPTAPPQQQQQTTRPTVIPPRRQIFWNTASISTETNFVLDVQANQAFGFGTDGKERLASKHPELIRYLPDGQDRDWLVDRKIIPSQNRNSRFLFLIYDEVKKLGQTDLYKDRDNLNLSILHIFKIPNFIIQKMKLFFIDLNIKSRGLITNSYSAMANSSHLRNALLQGSSQTTTSSISITSTTVATTSVNSVSTSTDAVSSPPKVKSSLSSSHATLTALLTNNSGTNGSSKVVAPSDKRASDNSQSGSTPDVCSTKTENSTKDV